MEITKTELKQLISNIVEESLAEESVVEGLTNAGSDGMIWVKVDKDGKGHWPIGWYEGAITKESENAILDIIKNDAIISA